MKNVFEYFEYLSGDSQAIVMNLNMFEGEVFNILESLKVTYFISINCHVSNKSYKSLEIITIKKNLYTAL